MLARPSLALFFAALSSTPIPSKLQNSQPEVVVFDNVLPKEGCDELHQIASKIGLGHRVFARPVKDTAARSNLELTIHNILSELGDEPTRSDNDQQYVEYWTRQEWRHIEAHADVDENLAKEQDREKSEDEPFRYPRHGHVLYLKIGSEVKGPTCVFPDHSSGGDLYKEFQPPSDTMSAGVDLISVPAKDGRLLRFHGSALHAVPRPTDIWFLPFVRGAPEYLPEEQWGRSVVLFNTWYGEPPKNVPMDDKWDKSPESMTQVNGFLEWDEVYSLKGDKSSSTIEETESCVGRSKKAKVWLLGNERRRSFPMRTISLPATEQVRDVLFHSSKVKQVKLRD